MKIYFNRKPRSGPWGGGNKFVGHLSDKLKDANHEVVYLLDSRDIDVIFCFDPRPNDRGEWYETFLQYRRLFGAKIIQRVGDLGTHGKPELTSLVSETLKFSDYFIFPSTWAKEKINFKGDNFALIPNRPLDIFLKNKRLNKNIQDKTRLITHHWSNNPKKGFNFYKSLANWCEGNDRYEFTYVGRLPDNFSLKNANYIAPCDATSLSQELPKHHIYLTASLEEAGANHVLEGMGSGLPVVYHEGGGSIVEYCNEFGKSFNSFESMIAAIKHVEENYQQYEKKLLKFDQGLDSVIDLYCGIICNLKST